ncbi:MAG: TrbC/VirB2 family protein [Rickettsiales bacterium]
MLGRRSGLVSLEGCSCSYNDNNYMRFVTGNLLVILLFLIFTNPVFAQNAISNTLCSVYGIIYYDIGRGLATLAIVALCVGGLLGRVTFGQVATVLAGMGVLFGAIRLAFALTPVSITSALSLTACGITGTIAQGSSFLNFAKNIFNPF